MANATAFWGSAGGNGADASCFAAQSTATATCNGNGNGEIWSAAGDNYIERFLAWKHLANAGLIEGSYTGKATSGANSYAPPAPGINMAAARISNGYFDPLYMVPQTYIFAGSRVNRNTITLYGWIGTQGGVIAPEEAWNIDTKLDDGSPVTGDMFHFNSTSSNCVTSDANTATYSLTINDKSCMPIFGL
jgi:hypothetical protein